MLLTYVFFFKATATTAIHTSCPLLSLPQPPPCCLGRDGEAQRREAGPEARRAQHPQRVLDEGRTDVAQHPRLDVARAAERIDQVAVSVLRDRVAGEVAAAQVFFQRPRRIGADDEAARAAPRLAFGSGDRTGVVLGTVEVLPV